MAYSPVEQGRLVEHPALRAIAASKHVTPAQVALAWLLRQPDIITIPKAGSVAHVRDNRAAGDLTLDEEDLTSLDRLFPEPNCKRPLDML